MNAKDMEAQLTDAARLMRVIQAAEDKVMFWKTVKSATVFVSDSGAINFYGVQAMSGAHHQLPGAHGDKVLTTIRHAVISGCGETIAAAKRQLCSLEVVDSSAVYPSV